MKFDKVRPITFIVFITVFSLHGCAGHGGVCSSSGYEGGGEEAVKTEIVFGHAKPDGQEVSQEVSQEISEDEWRGFVEDYVTPNFPEGLTIINSDGQWMAESGKVIKEKSKVLVLLHENSPKAHQKIDFIRAKYKELFDQESVLRISAPTCVSF